MKTNTLDLDLYRRTGVVAPAAIATADELAREGRGDLAAEIARVDQIILTYELRVADWRRLAPLMTSHEGAELVAYALREDIHQLNHARMLRTVIERQAAAA